MAAGSPNPASVVTGVQFACTAAVLRLLSQWGQLTLQEEQARVLLGILRGLAEQQPGLHGVLAGVLGGLGAEATSGNREYVVSGWHCIGYVQSNVLYWLHGDVRKRASMQAVAPVRAGHGVELLRCILRGLQGIMQGLAE